MYDQLRAMGIFSCVVEQGSFSAAARVLGVTTSAVSQQVSSLEDTLQVTLLRRSTRKINLTDEGEVFFYSCKKMLNAATCATNQLLELKEVITGSLNIVAPPTLATKYIVPALSDWLSTHQKIELKIETNINSNVSCEYSDVDIFIKLTCDDQRKATHLASLKQVLITSPDYVKQMTKILHPNDLIDHFFIKINTLPQVEYLDFNGVAEVATVQMNSKFCTNDTSVAKALCKMSQGILCIPLIEIQEELLQGEFVVLLPEWTLDHLFIYAFATENVRATKKVQQCLNILTHYFKYSFSA